MIWYGYLPQIVAGFLSLLVLTISYFFIKRRYTQSLVACQNSTGESDVYACSENLSNESSSESLNLDHENNEELLKFIDTDLYNKIYCDLHFDTTLMKKKTMHINNVMGHSGYVSTEDEMQESNNYTTTQEVSDNCKFNSDSHSSIMSWESCHDGIDHSELDFVNCLSSENHPEICQPLNLCIRDKKNETGTNKITITFFTDRKHKSIKGLHKNNSEQFLVTKMIEDYDQRSSLDCENVKNLNCCENKEYTLNNVKLEHNLNNTDHELRDEHNLEITEFSSAYQGDLEDEHNLDNTDHELRDEHNLDISELSSIHHDEYSLNNTEHELKDEHNLEITELSSTYQGDLEDEHNLDNTDHELRDEHNLEITELSSTYQGDLEDEHNLDNTDHELRDEHNLDISELSSIHHDEHSLNNTEHELKDEHNLEITELSSTYQGDLEDEHNLDNTDHELRDEHNLDISELSSIHHDEHSLNNTEHELKDEHNLEITELSSTYQGDLEDEHNLDNTDHELRDEHNLDISELSSIHHDEHSLNNTEHELKDEHNLEITELSSTYQGDLEDEHNLDNTDHELRDEHNLEITELSSTYQGDLEDEHNLDNTDHALRDEHNLEITELSSIHHDEYTLNNTEHSSSDDHVMRENGLETTKFFPNHQDEKNNKYNCLTSLELSSLNNDKSVSGINTPIIICHHDYDVHYVNGFNNTFSSECTESFPSPIFNNDSSIDDIRYVEDYNDISFFDPTLSDDAMNEAFIED